MKRDVISTRQFMVLIVTALLMPASALLPTMTARAAGSAGWLSALGAIPFLLGAGWAMEGFWRHGQESNGSILRNTVAVIYMLWTLLLLMLCLRLSRARLEEIYGETAAAACVAAMLLLAVWMALGKLTAFVRAVEIFYLALALLLAGLLVLAAFKVEWSNFSITLEEVSGLPQSGAAAAGLLLNIYPAAVLLRSKTTQGRKKCYKVKWIVVFCIVLTLLLGAVTGCLGAKLAGKISSPFLIMVQGLGVQGVFQRAEALIIAVWTLSDLALAGLLLHTWKALAGSLYPGKWSRRSIIPAAAVTIIGGWVLFNNVETMWRFCSQVLPGLGILLGLVCPVIARSIVLIRGKNEAR